MNNSFDKIAPGTHNKVHLAVDLALAAVGVLLAMPEGHQSVHWALLCLAAATAWMVAAVMLRLYSPSTPRRLVDNLILRAIGVMAGVVVLKVLAILLPGLDAQAVIVRNFAAFFFVCSALVRAAIFKPVARFAKPLQEVLIIGTGHLARTTYKNLTTAEPDRRAHVVGFLALKNQSTQDEDLGAPVLGVADQLLEVLSEHPVSEVYLAARVTEYAEEMQKAVSACEHIGIPFALPLHSLLFERARLLSSSPARDGYLHYMSTAWKPMQYALKRFMDITASAVALIILSPLLIGVAVAIKFTSRGPVMFKQKRVGLHGVTFNLLKFRSMVVDAEALKDKLMAQNEQSGPVFKMALDPRITGIGHFIRRYSIDELPQLINILRGDMTIVGPRPAVPKEVAQYKAWQRRRLSVRPGLTCYWQVGGRNNIGFEEWMRLDLRYVDNWNLAVDFQLILMTFPAVLAGRGAS
jgi:exopolysaccharide biosynthesis polyprenyl glycosylphosphotransferase